MIFSSLGVCFFSKLVLKNAVWCRALQLVLKSDIFSLQKLMLLLRTGMRAVTPYGVVTEQSIVHVKMSASAIKSSCTRITRIKSSPRRLSEDQRTNVCLGGFGLSARHMCITQKPLAFRQRHGTHRYAKEQLPKHSQSKFELPSGIQNRWTH